MLALLSFVACLPGVLEVQVTEPVAPPVSMADVQPGGCGLEPYAWLDTEEMGQIVSVEFVPELSLTTGLLNAALADFQVDALELRYDVDMYRVRYTSQDRGKKVESTMLVSYPVTDEPVPTVVWLHGTTGFTDECAPSNMGLEGAGGNLLLSSLGAITIAPDYLGLNGFGEPSGQLHPYAAAEPSAISALDAIRAGLRMPEEVATLPATPTGDVALFGGSEGGFTAFWADRYQPYYLPGVPFVAGVASVPPTDLVGIVEHATSGAYSSSAATAGVLTTWSDWYRWGEDLDRVLLAEFADVLPDLMLEECNPTHVLDDITEPSQLFTASFLAAGQSRDYSGMEDIECMLVSNSIVTAELPRANDTPFLYVVSELDDLVPAGPTRDAFLPMCDDGYRMNYIECAGAGHTDGAVWSIPEQWHWLSDRLEGKAMEDTCVLTAPVVCSLTDVTRD